MISDPPPFHGTKLTPLVVIFNIQFLQPTINKTEYGLIYKTLNLLVYKKIRLVYFSY